MGRAAVTICLIAGFSLLVALILIATGTIEGAKVPDTWSSVHSDDLYAESSQDQWQGHRLGKTDLPPLLPCNYPNL
jgi:hypothetical protein